MDRKKEIELIKNVFTEILIVLLSLSLGAIMIFLLGTEIAVIIPQKAQLGMGILCLLGIISGSAKILHAILKLQTAN